METEEVGDPPDAPLKKGDVCVSDAPGWHKWPFILDRHLHRRGAAWMYGGHDIGPIGGRFRLATIDDIQKCIADQEKAISEVNERIKFLRQCQVTILLRAGATS